MESQQLIDKVEQVGSTIRVHASAGFHQEYLRETFFIEVDLGDREVKALPTEVALIPFLLNIAPLVWLSGAEYTVPICDRRLLDSLEAVRHTFIDMFPAQAWDGRVMAQNVVEVGEASGPTAETGDLVLFSGGVDSLYTATRADKPKGVLLLIWGNDIALDNHAGWEAIRRSAASTADSLGHGIAFARTNFRSFLDHTVLQQRLPDITSYWGYIQHGLGLVGIAIPVAFALGCRDVVIAATHNPTYGQPWGSGPAIEGALRWGRYRVMHHGFEVTRQEKLRSITTSSTTEDRLALRVCYAYPYSDGTNCTRCEKCLRTAIGILLEGEDPNSFGFPVPPDRLLRRIRWRFALRRIPMGEDEEFMWTDVRARAEELYGDEEVTPESARALAIRWLINMDFHKYRQDSSWMRRLRESAIRFVRRRPRLEKFVRRLQARTRS